MPIPSKYFAHDTLDPISLDTFSVLFGNRDSESAAIGSFDFVDDQQTLCVYLLTTFLDAEVLFAPEDPVFFSELF